MPSKVDKVNQPRTETPAAPAAAVLDIGEQLHALMHRIKRHHQQAARALGDALAPMEARALGYFARHPGASARDLVEHAGRDKAQVARLVRSLIDRGLLEATPSPTDQRSQCLALTAAGTALQRQLSSSRRRIDAALIAGLSDKEREQLSRLLARLHASLGEP